MNVLFLVDGYEESGDPTDTIRMLQEARSDGWLRGDIIGLIINNSQWIDDEPWKARSSTPLQDEILQQFNSWPSTTHS